MLEAAAQQRQLETRPAGGAIQVARGKRRPREAARLQTPAEEGQQSRGQRRDHRRRGNLRQGFPGGHGQRQQMLHRECDREVLQDLVP